MKKCFTINPFRTTEDFLSYEELIKDNIYQAIEIFFPYNLDEEKRKIYFNNVKRIKELYPQTEVVMHLPHGPSSNLCDFLGYKEIVQRMKDGMDFTSHFETKKLTLHLGQVLKEVDRSKYIEHIVEVLKDLCEYAKKYQMNVMIENMPASHELGYSPLEIKEIIEKTGYDNLKLILDTGHAHVSDYSNEEYIELLKDYLYHMHFSDNNGSRDEHKRIGLGNIDFEKLFKKLKEVGYDHLHCMEVIFNKKEELIAFAGDLAKYDK